MQQQMIARTRAAALTGAVFIGSLVASGPAPAQTPLIVYPPLPPEVAHLGDRPGPGTFAAAPRSYGGDPRDFRNVPMGVAPRVGCYGGREQVMDRFGQLVWVPNVTCDGN